MNVSLEFAVPTVGLASTLAFVVGRDDVMVGVWCLYFAAWAVMVVRRHVARRACECALEAVTCEAERVATDGGRVSWFEDALVRFDPVKAERVRRRRTRT